jgi:hypothetical protein
MQNSNDPLQTVVESFKKLGWISQIERLGRDGFAVKDSDNNEKFDVYFYRVGKHLSLEGKEIAAAIQFSVYVVMPWSEQIKNNEFNIPIDDVPIDSNLDEHVQTIVDQITAFVLPERPTPLEVENYKFDKKADQKYDLSI